MFKIITSNPCLHKHINRKGWCDCHEWLQEVPRLSFKGYLKLIFLTNIYVRRIK